MIQQRMQNWLLKRADLSPERIALIDGEVCWTFRQLYTEAQKTARRLRNAGLRPGDRVALLLTNTFHMPQLIHAIQQLGAVTVLLNTRLTAEELSWQVQDSGCKMLVYDEVFAETVQDMVIKEQQIGLLSYGKLEKMMEEVGDLPEEIDLAAVHTIIYTSGTTGRPKGVLLTNGNHWWSAMGSVLNLGLTLQDRWLVCVPLFHMSGLSILLRSVVYGIPAVIHPRFSPTAVNEAIKNQGITMVSVVSAMLFRLLESLGPMTYPSDFRCMLVGGGPVPSGLLEQCRQKEIPVYQTYGLTETASQFVTLSPEYMDKKLGSAGKSLFPSELKIMAAGATAEPGQAGEILVRGPNITQGYLHGRGAENFLSDGWLCTGDMGYVDEDGFLYVLDRRSDLIISGGENVYPAEVEAVLSTHPAILEAGVAGISDRTWGQVPAAFIVVRPGTLVAVGEVQDFCRGHLAGYKCPNRVYFVNKLPRNGVNKLVRRELIRLIPSLEAAERG